MKQTVHCSAPVVCFCNSNRAWGGGEKWHLEAALSMAERGARVFLMAGEGTPLMERAKQYPELTLHARRFSGCDFCNPLTLRSCAKFFRENGISRVLLGLPADMKAAGLAAKLAGVSGIYYRRGSALPVKNSWLNRFLYQDVLTGLIVNSRETERLVFAAGDTLIAKKKVTLLPNGIDVAAFDAAYAKAEPLWQRKDGIPVIGNAGRLTTQKGQQYLLHMSRALLNSGIPHTLLIAGEGEREAELKALAKTLGLEDTVVFTGFLPDMAPFWRSIDFFVLSSLWEGFGYVLAESMLAGKTILAFNGNSMPEVVTDGETGLLVPLPTADESPENTGERLAASARFLITEPATTARLAAGGRTHCRQTYDQKRCMDTLYALLWPEYTHDA